MPHPTALQRQIWSGSLPLHISLSPTSCRTYSDSLPYLIQIPRLSYLAFLLPRLHSFFTPNLIDPTAAATKAWLEFEGVPLKWHYAAGLLYDLYTAGTGLPSDEAPPSAPWKLDLCFGPVPPVGLVMLDAEGRVLEDFYMNAVKEADFVRNGSARTVMGLSRGDSEGLWRSVREHDLALFNAVNAKLLDPPGVTLRHIPLKIYLPAPTAGGAAITTTAEPIPEDAAEADAAAAGHVRVVQALVPLLGPQRKPQTLGSALKTVLPDVFPSSRNPILALPVLHGAVVPMLADLDGLARGAGYADGWLHVVVVMMG